MQQLRGLPLISEAVCHLHRPVTDDAGSCLCRQGRSSPRKSAAFRNGNRAAILAVRYRNSGVMGLLFVNSVEKLCANDPEQAHALSRRMRMSTLPYTDRRVEW